MRYFIRFEQGNAIRVDLLFVKSIGNDLYECEDHYGCSYTLHRSRIIEDFD